LKTKLINWYFTKGRFNITWNQWNANS